MPNDNEVFDLMKRAYPLEPRQEFVSETLFNLKQAARKKNRSKKMKLFSVASISIAICAFALVSFFILDEKQNTSINSHVRNAASVPASSHLKPAVYIYHTHNRESFDVVTKTNDPSKMSHNRKNITLVGARLKKTLEKKKIPSLHDQTDVMKKLEENKLSFPMAYEISQKPLKKALAQHKSLLMVFDIHRDSRKRNETTIKLNGKEFAKISFVVSRLNVNYKENLAFAQEMHKRLQELYPGLSRGVYINDKPFNNNTYNQELFSQSALIEIGGIENTFKEEYRSADALAKIIKEMIVDKNK